MESDENKKQRMSPHSIKAGLISTSCIELCIVLLLTLYILRMWLSYIKRLKTQIDNETSFDSKNYNKKASNNKVRKKKKSFLTTVEETQDTGE